MSQSIDQAFISQFETEVKLDYQRMGAMFVNMIRRKVNVTGQDTTFQKAGKGRAGKKTRHGKVPLMNLVHTKVKCTIEDYYAADYVDELDELKTNIDERKVVTQSGAAAIGRTQDDIVVGVLSASATNVVLAGGTGLTQTKVTNTFESMSAGDIPDDGERYFAVDPRVWTDLLGITAFSSSDYIDTQDLPYKGGMTAKHWLGFTIFPFSGLQDGAGGATEARNLAWHSAAVGTASGKDIALDTWWDGSVQGWLFTYKMAMGAVVIDDKGVFVVDAVR